MIYGVQGKVVLRIGFVADSLHLTVIDKINNIARYNPIDTKYLQMAFRLAT